MGKQKVEMKRGKGLLESGGYAAMARKLGSPFLKLAVGCTYVGEKSRHGTSL